VLTLRSTVLGADLVFTTNSSACLQACREIETTEPGASLLDVPLGVDIQLQGDAWTLSSSGQVVLAGSGDGMLPVALQDAVSGLICDRLPDFTGVAASLVTIAGQCVLLVGAEEVVTPALLALLARAAEGYGGHLVLVNNGECVPFPRRLRLPESARFPAGMLSPLPEPRWQGLPQQRFRFFDPTDLGLPWRFDRCAPSVIVHLVPDGGGQRGATPLSRIELAQQLISAAPDLPRRPRTTIAALTALAAACAGYRVGCGGEADVAAESVLRLLSPDPLPLEPQPERRRTRVLVWGDSGTSCTGFATVIRHLVKGLAATGLYEIDQIGINFTGDYYDRAEHPCRLYPALAPGYRDVFGRDRLLKVLAGEDAALPGPWDILFSLQDHFVVDEIQGELAAARARLAAAGRPLTWIGYWPVDSRLRERWVTGVIMAPDFPVLYTSHGLEEVLRFDPAGERGYRQRLHVIPHGVDCGSFHPLPDAETAAFRERFCAGKVGPGTFLVVNVNRNQPRKDLARTMAAFALLHGEEPESFLYLHAAAKDVGGNLFEIAEDLGLVHGRDWSCPVGFDPRYGVPVADLNRIYNAADVVVTTTLGEGWGLSITESMAAGTPVVAPHHTSIPELLGNRTPAERVRGISVPCGGASLRICLGGGDLGRTRPLTDVEELSRRLLFVRAHPEETARFTGAAREWVQGLRWERILEEDWLPLFARATRQRSAPGRIDFS